MKCSKSLLILFFLVLVSFQCFAQSVTICTKIRGNTGIEDKFKKELVSKFSKLKDVIAVEDKQNAHVYFDATLVEQKELQFYALGFCIAYHLNGKFYSRPIADVAQFGKERMVEVCDFIAKQIDKAFVEPIRKNA